jgi:tetratricopeptide (TPR) repeat protein
MADIKELYEKALQLYDKQNYNDTITNLKKILAQDDTVHQAWCLIGNSYAMLNNYEFAEKAFKKAVELQPQDEQYLQYLAHTYFFADEIEKAFEWYGRLLQVNNKNFDGLLYSAKCYNLYEQPADAMKVLKDAQKLKLDKQQKQELKDELAYTYMMLGYTAWPVYDEEGNRFPKNHRQYRKAKKNLKKAQELSPKDDYVKGELKWFKGAVKNSKKRIFAGSWLVIIFTVIFAFFAMGGVKGCSWERHKEILKNEAEVMPKLAQTAITSLIEQGNLEKVETLAQDQVYMEKFDGRNLSFYRLGYIWLFFLILYIFASRCPLYLANRRLKNYGKISGAIGDTMDSLQRSDRRWKVTYSDGSTSYEDEYAGTVLSLILMAVSIILTLLLLPVSVIINFLRNYIFKI